MVSLPQYTAYVIRLNGYGNKEGMPIIKQSYYSV